MNLKKRLRKSIILGLVGVTIATPMFSTVSACETNNLSYNATEPIMIDDNVPEGTVVEISDSEMLKVFEEAGIDKSILKESGFYNNSNNNVRSARAYHAGVTKAVKIKGGYDIYLSKSTLNTMKKGGSQAVAAGLTSLLGSPFAYVISPVLGKVINGLTPNFKGGMVFTVRLKNVNGYNVWDCNYRNQ